MIDNFNAKTATAFTVMATSLGVCVWSMAAGNVPVAVGGALVAGISQFIMHAGSPAPQNIEAPDVIPMNTYK